MIDDENEEFEPEMGVPTAGHAALQIADFRRLLSARFFVTVALQIQSLAVGWQVYELTKNPLFLGLIGLAEIIPAISVSLYAGHVADVRDRRRIAIATVLTLAFCVYGLSAVSAFGSPDYRLYAIYGLVALTGFARGFLSPSMFGLVSQIVPRNLFGNAAAWNSTLWQISAISGPVLGGFLFLQEGAALTFLISAFLLSVSILPLLMIESRSNLSSAPEGSVHNSIMEGLKFVFSNQILLAAMSLDLFAVLFGGAVALLPIFAAEIFLSGPEALGWLRAAPGIGALFITGIVAFNPIRKHAGRLLLCSVGAYGLCMIAFALSRDFILSLLILAVSGIFDGISIYVRGTVFQVTTPDDMKGRVASVNSIFIGSSNEIGEFESGVAAKLIGTVPSVIFGGCVTLFVVLVTAIKAPKLRQLELE